MDKSQVLGALANYRKAQFINASWKSNIESAKARKQGILVEKQTTVVVRLGLNYSKMKAVIEKQENSTPSDNPKPKWWKKTSEKFIVCHKDYEDRLYLRMYSAYVTNKKTQYYVNGVECSKEDAMQHCNASTFAPKEASDTILVKLENLVSIGGNNNG